MLRLLLLIAVFFAASLMAENTEELHHKLDLIAGVNPTPDVVALDAFSKQLSANAPATVVTRLKTYQAIAAAITANDKDTADHILHTLKSAITGQEQLIDTLLAKGEIALHYKQQQELDEVVAELKSLSEQAVAVRQQFFVFSFLNRALQGTDIKQALLYLNKAHDVLSAYQDNLSFQRRQFIQYHIARTHVLANNYQYAKTFVSKAIEEALQHNLTQLLPELYLVRGFATQALTNLSDVGAEALADFIKASIVPAGQQPGRTQMVALNNIGAAYFYRGDYQKASGYYEQSIDLAHKLNSNDIQVMLFNQGYVQVMLGQQEQGLLQMEQAFIKFNEQAMPFDQISMLGYLADAYKAVKQYEKEAATLREQIKKREQSLQSERAKAVSELQVQYETQEQALRIQLLEQETALKQAELESSSRNQFWYSVLALLLGFALLVSLFLVRHVRKLNTLLHNANSELQHLSENDPLTKLNNRRVLAQFKQQQNDLLLLIDIDHFKRINDDYGHNVGDQVLVELAKRLKASIRAEDLVARWGGEEFLIVIRNVSPEKVETIIESLLCDISQNPIAGLTISVSGGVLLVDEQTTSLEESINRADQLLYQAKHAGRAKIYSYKDGQFKIWHCPPGNYFYLNTTDKPATTD